MTRRQRKAERIYAEWRAKILELPIQEAMELNYQFYRSMRKVRRPAPIGKYRTEAAEKLHKAIMNSTGLGAVMGLFQTDDSVMKIAERDLLISYAEMVPIRGHRHRKQRERQEAQNG